MFVRSGLVLGLLWNSLFRFILGSEIPILADTDNKSVENVAGRNDYLAMVNQIANLYSAPQPEAPHEPSPPVSVSYDTLMAPLVFGINELVVDRNRRMRAKFKEILEFLFPNCQYSLGFYYIYNWPEDVNLYKDPWTINELDEINRRIPLMKFFFKRRTYSLDKELGFNTMKCLIHAELDSLMTYESAMKIVFDKFKVQSGLLIYNSIDWSLLDRRDIPEKYKEVPLNSETLQSALIFCNREIIDNIHFYSRRHLTGGQAVIASNNDLVVPTPISSEPENTNIPKLIEIYDRDERLKQLKKALKDMFKRQYPEQLYSKNQYEILNWPHGVDFKKSRWTNYEMSLIESNFKEFKFVLKSSLKVDGAFEIFSKFLLQKFRDETGNQNAQSIDWDLLNKSRIPIEYSGLIFDDSTMSQPQYYQNPLIVHNIHFIHPLEKKRKFAESDSE